MNVSSLIFWISAFDAVAITVVGAIAAGMFILGREMDQFMDRIVPAAAILIGTSLAAGIIMSLGRWLAG